MKRSVANLALGVGLCLPILVPQMAQGQAPALVPGKEYSNHIDNDAGWLPDPLQNLSWDGLGGNADAFDYSGSGPPPEDPDQVDALANTTDFLFGNILGGTAAMVLSTDTENFIRYHDVTGAVGIWATKEEVRDMPPHAEHADDVDALEIWGSEGPNANHYSYIGDYIDPVPPGGGFPKVSLFYYDGVFSTPYLLHDPLLLELETSFDIDLTEVDVDALMMHDIDDEAEFGLGDSIIFSLRPTGPFDGGEIFVWTLGAGPIGFLSQGGVLWDTANSVTGIFGSASENINALEAIAPIPEPTSLALVVMSSFMFVRRRR